MSIRMTFNQITTNTELGRGGIGFFIEETASTNTKLTLVQSLGGILYYDALLATGSGLPSNSPLTDPWVDLINAYDGDLTNFAGTTASGWDITDPTKPFLKEDGTNDYVITALGAANFPTSFSLYSRCKTGTATGFASLGSIDLNEASANALFTMYKASTDHKFRAYIANTAGAIFTAISNDARVVNTDYVICATYNDSTKKLTLYVNKTKQTTEGTLTGTRGTPNGYLHAGCGIYNNARESYWDGCIYSTVLFNKALSEAEISNLIDAGV